MKKLIIRIALVLVGIISVVLGRWFFFDSSDFYTPPPSERPSYEQFVIPPAVSTDFIDVYEEGEGVILIDLAHDNDFDKGELNVLLLRLVSRGLTIKFLSEEDDLEKELVGEEEEEEDLEGWPPSEEEGEEPEEEPPSEEAQVGEEPLSEEEEEEEVEPLPDAFIIVAPRSEFSKEERETVDKFVSNGGKLLLIADPTRRDEINSLSLQFGLIFEPDYLYNMKENEINYRNIFITEFKENEITKELEKIALYTAGSISSANSSIAFIDENTFSSVIETRERLSPIALAQESRVVAIYDLTFMTEPYNGALDNNQLISNVSDWLMPPAEGTESK